VPGRGCPESVGHLDKSTLNHILEVQKLPTEKKNFVINMIDMALRDFKVKQAHAS